MTFNFEHTFKKAQREFFNKPLKFHPFKEMLKKVFVKNSENQKVVLPKKTDR